MDLGLIQSSCLQAACDARLPPCRVSHRRGRAALQHREEGTPPGGGTLQGPHVHVCWFEAVVGGCIFWACFPHAGEMLNLLP